MFTLTTQHLRQLLDANSFPAPPPDATFVFLGLRGCLPLNPDDQRFAATQTLVTTDVNYVNPRCTLIQWRPARNDFAVFPGSTVPHRSYVEEAVRAGGEGANQLMTGYYADYRKGVHKPGTPTAHDAFRQTEGRPIRRTTNDLTYDETDPVDVTNPCDNLHAGWCMGVSHDYYASAGCQVLVGYPRCAQRGVGGTGRQTHHVGDGHGRWRHRHHERDG